MNKFNIYFLVTSLIVLYVLVIGSLLFQDGLTKPQIDESACNNVCANSYFSGVVGSQIIESDCYCLLYNGIEFTAVPPDVSGKKRMLMPEIFNQRRN